MIGPLLPARSRRAHVAMVLPHQRHPRRGGQVVAGMLAPKPGKPGAGRPPGSKNRRPATHHDVGKTTKREPTLRHDANAQVKRQAKQQSVLSRSAHTRPRLRGRRVSKGALWLETGSLHVGGRVFLVSSGSLSSASARHSSRFRIRAVCALPRMSDGAGGTAGLAAGLAGIDRLIRVTSCLC